MIYCHKATRRCIRAYCLRWRVQCNKQCKLHPNVFALCFIPSGLLGQAYHDSRQLRGVDALFPRGGGVATTRRSLCWFFNLIFIDYFTNSGHVQINRADSRHVWEVLLHNCVLARVHRLGCLRMDVVLSLSSFFFSRCLSGVAQSDVTDAVWCYWWRGLMLLTQSDVTDDVVWCYWRSLMLLMTWSDVTDAVWCYWWRGLMLLTQSDVTDDVVWCYWRSLMLLMTWSDVTDAVWCYWWRGLMLLTQSDVTDDVVWSFLFGSYWRLLMFLTVPCMSVTWVVHHQSMCEYRNQ